MADIKQIKVGSTTYDIKAKAFDGTLPIANGGTNATTTAAAKVSLNLCAEGQDVRLANYSSTSQIWGFRAKCVNTSNTDYNNKDIGLIADNTKLLLYNHSDNGGAIWSIAPNDYVLKTGDTLTGNIFIKNNSITKGTNPSSSQWRYISFTDSGGTASSNRTGWIASGVDGDGLSQTRLTAYRYTSGSTDEIRIQVNMPKSGNGYIDVSGANVSTAAVRNISYGTGTPSGGSAGQVYIQYFN